MARQVAKKKQRSVSRAGRPGAKRAASAAREGIFADVMNTCEMAAHRRAGRIVLLPLGCFEMHGVQAAMSTDTFIAEATCRILAPEWDAIIYPPVHYCYPGASTPWPGTVSVRPRETIDYLVGVIRAINANGFHKVILVNLHYPNLAIIEVALREIFEATGEIAILYTPGYERLCAAVEKELGAPHGEAALLLASMYLCGRHGEFDPAATPAETLEGPRYPFPCGGKLRRCGVTFPYHFVKPNNHVGRYPGLTLEDAPRIAEMYRRIVLESASDVPALYDELLKETARARKSAPWSQL